MNLYEADVQGTRGSMGHIEKGQRTQNAHHYRKNTRCDPKVFRQLL